jgi:hypothetical protein
MTRKQKSVYNRNYRLKKKRERQAAKEVNGEEPVRKKRRRPNHDAVIYLRHARTAMTEQVVSGQASLDDPVYLFAMLALRALEQQ